MTVNDAIMLLRAHVLEGRGDWPLTRLAASMDSEHTTPKRRLVEVTRLEVVERPQGRGVAAENCIQVR